MTKRTIEIEVFTIESHPEPELCLDWVRNNWHDLGDHVLQDATLSLKAFADHIGATLDYAISIVPDRGEYISIDTRIESLGDIMLHLDLSGNCPFTGVFYDEIILDAFRDAAKNATAKLDDVLSEIEYGMLKAIHDEGEYIYSDDGLRDMCEANEYEFNVDGSIF